MAAYISGARTSCPTVDFGRPRLLGPRKHFGAYPAVSGLRALGPSYSYDVWSFIISRLRCQSFTSGMGVNIDRSLELRSAITIDLIEELKTAPRTSLLGFFETELHSTLTVYISGADYSLVKQTQHRPKTE